MALTEAAQALYNTDSNFREALGGVQVVSDQGDKTGKNSNPSIQLSNTKSQTQQRPERKWPGAEPSYEASTCPLLGNAREALTQTLPVTIQ